MVDSIPSELLADAIPQVPAGSQLEIDSKPQQQLLAVQPTAKADSPHPPSPPAPASPWTRPLTLIVQLESLLDHPDCDPWVSDVRQQLNYMAAMRSIDSPEMASVLRQLEKCVQTARDDASQFEFGELRTNYHRAIYALEKRIAVWEKIYDIAVKKRQEFGKGLRFDERIADPLDATVALFHDDDQRDAWVHYLAIDQIRKVVGTGGISGERHCEIAQLALERIESNNLTPSQRAFLSSPTVSRLKQELQYWLARSLDHEEFLARLERFEQTPNAEDATYLTHFSRSLHLTSDANSHDLGQRIDTHWRNANFRVAVSGKLLNRFLPEPISERDPVHDTILGTSVHGISRTTTRLHIRLLPDPQRIRIGVEAYGDVASATRGQNGPVRTVNQGRTTYSAKKVLVMDIHGLHRHETEADSETATDVVGFRTEYDGVPLLGSMARARVQSEIRNRNGAANSIVNQRVTTSVRQRLNAEVDKHLRRLETELSKKALIPLQRLMVKATPVSFRTTNERAIARYRIAGDNQLAAYTPRPQAPSDSMLSVQVHQSALNNLMNKLNLEGNQFELEDLYNIIPEKLGRNAAEIPEDLPENVKVKFAARDAVRFYFDDGRIQVVVRLARLDSGRSHRWRNITFQAFYRLEKTDHQLHFIRDGSIQLIAQRLSITDQMALRGIFSKVLAKNRKHVIVDEETSRDVKFTDLKLHQCVMRDGWLGLAWGAARPEKWRTADGDSATSR